MNKPTAKSCPLLDELRVTPGNRAYREDKKWLNLLCQFCPISFLIGGECVYDVDFRGQSKKLVDKLAKVVAPIVKEWVKDEGT